MTESSPPDVAQLVSSIADIAEAVAPKDYETLHVVGVFDLEEASGVDAHAVVAGQRVPLRVGIEALHRFDEMRKACADAHQPLWLTAAVTVTAGGEARIAYSYAH